MDNQEVKESAELREKATAWLNSKNRDIDSGLEILREANYKPHVISIFEANKNRRDIPDKVTQEIRNYLRYFANPTKDIHKDELLPEDADLLVKEKEFMSNIQIEIANDQYPDIVKQLLVEFNEDYNKRSIAHKEIKEVGESNDDESCGKRKVLMNRIKNYSSRMDILWPLFEAYKADPEALPSEEIVLAAFNPDEVTEEDANDDDEKKDGKELVLATTVDGLKKQSENWRTKLLKAENKLNFGTEKKADKPNPIPEGPTRIKQVKRIERLTAEKLAIDTALANMQ
jgi:hypothetical protein